MGQAEKQLRLGFKNCTAKTCWSATTCTSGHCSRWRACLLIKVLALSHPALQMMPKVQRHLYSAKTRSTTPHCVALLLAHATLQRTRGSSTRRTPAIALKRYHCLGQRIAKTLTDTSSPDREARTTWHSRVSHSCPCGQRSSRPLKKVCFSFYTNPHCFSCRIACLTCRYQDPEW